MTPSQKDFITQLFKENFPMVKGIINGLLLSHNRDDISSCCQDTFLLAVEHTEELEQHENPGGWLALTARNYALRFNQEYRKQQARVLELTEATENPSREMETLTAESTFEEKIINHLSQPEKLLYYLKFKEGLPDSRIITLLNMTKAQYRTRLCRMKKRIKRDLERHLNE